MAFVPSRVFVLAVLAPLAALAPLHLACTTGDDDDGGESAVTAVTPSTTDAVTTGAAPTTGSATTTTGGDGTTTADPTTTTTSSTTEEPTTGLTEASGSDSSGGSDDTGPICEAGQPSCACDDGTCIDGYVCAMGVCAESLACPGDIEPPGESEDTPVELGDITDDDDDFFEQAGVLSGVSDVDWYHLHGADTFGHVAEPTLTLSAGSQRSCLFLQCDEGGVALTTVECPAGTDFAISPKLRPGCCGSATFTIKDIGCPGQDESMQMWARLDKPAADSCSDYDLQVHF